MVAWCPSDSNDDGELVQVVFDDKSASTTLTVGEFNQCRAAYIVMTDQLARKQKSGGKMKDDREE